MSQPKPTQITYHQPTRVLTVAFDNDEIFAMSAEHLRVHSPSAEVQGHGPGQEVLQKGKEQVKIDAIEAVGQYAVTLVFDDNHNSGIYTWQVLYNLGKNHDQLWATYLERLQQAGYQRQSLGGEHV